VLITSNVLTVSGSRSRCSCKAQLC